jgi:hypothetical protein
MFNAPRQNTRSASEYQGAINGSIPKGLRNNARSYDEEFHYTAGCGEMNTLFSDDGGGSMMGSGDEMCKQNVGTLAVSRYHQLDRVLLNSEIKSYSDHDFPVGPRYLLEAAGYNILHPHVQPEQLEVFAADGATGLLKLYDARRHGAKVPPLVSDKEGRPRIDFSHQGASWVFTRSAKYDAVNAAKHANDLHNIIAEHKPSCSALLVIGDNGPTWSIKSLLLLYFYFRLFKLRKLDVLIVTAHSPGCSAHNWWVEHEWAFSSKKLTGKVCTTPVLTGTRNRPAKCLDCQQKRWCNARRLCLSGLLEHNLRSGMGSSSINTGLRRKCRQD